MIMCIPSLFPYNDKYLQNLKWVYIRILKGDYKACLFLVMITHDESLLTQENEIFSCFGGYICYPSTFNKYYQVYVYKLKQIVSLFT